MSDATYPEILRAEGFEPIGQLHHRLAMSIWWHPSPDRLLEVLVVNMGGATLLKGQKSYYLQSVSAAGETWARDIGPLHDYLEAHFPELRIGFSHFRDVPPELAEQEVRRRLAVEAPTLLIPSVEQIAQLQRDLAAAKQESGSLAQLLSLSRRPADLLSSHLQQQARGGAQAVQQLESKLEQQQARSTLFRHLQRQYQQKGSAAVYSFSISSNLQVAQDSDGFRDGLRAVVKELGDLHRFQVLQKLQGGRLNILVDESKEPLLGWIEQWLGGALSPRQLSRLGPEFETLRKPSQARMMVTPDEPIMVDNHVRHPEKHVAARFLSTALQRMDVTPSGSARGSLDPANLPPEMMPLRVGQLHDQAGGKTGPALLPLAQMIHVYISGTTGSGKSFLTRAIVEEASQYKQLNILVLDPRNQFVGLLVPEDRRAILERYESFGMKPAQARGFAFRYFAPGLPPFPRLPADLSSLVNGRTIVSGKGMEDGPRCALAAKVLNAAFDTTSAAESEFPRLLIVVDEAQLLTRKRVDDSAKDAAEQAERALDRIAREGRKYGIVLMLVSQTIKDFAYELASLRQMTTTKIFLRNSDREIEYAADILGDGRPLAQLPTGTALVHNANWGTLRLAVRPPYSKVQELPEAYIRCLIGTQAKQIPPLSDGAQQLLKVIRNHPAAPHPPLNLSQAAILGKITSKRKLLELVNELEKADAIRTRKLKERGQPRTIEATKGLYPF